ncbi:Uu.00g138570.m01.CDS01 [Anthostomella pinea]|uniref:Uu.00g138570.m01.CDS01 n=1 Tax=Anthostomella pinea TaxID=933095 RepID=A0AAI8VPP4_9PEZI|nr:Uu.00g138570.m01.CDS01 [Anthostomella pinea]
MKTPTRYLPQTLLFSTSSRLYSNCFHSRTVARRVSLYPSDPLRAQSNPARILCRPCPASIRPGGPIPQLHSGEHCSRRLYVPPAVFRTGKLNRITPALSGQSAKSRKQLQSQISSALYIVPLVVVGALLAFEVIPGNSSHPLTPEDEARDSYIAEAEEDMEALPGRPGNLTPDEEDKLRKFWEMFLHVCGVFDEDGAGEADTPTTLEAQGKTATGGSEKPKKKRMGLFKKKKDKGKESKTEKMDSIKESDAEDKWGENKAYHETLAKHTPEEIRATIWAMVKHDNPDALLLRFLRARKWDLQRALVMLISTMNWRCSEMRVDDDIMANGEEHAVLNEKSGDEKTKKLSEDFLAQMRIGKSYCYGIDKSGRPICVVRARLHKSGEQSEEALERFTVYLIETTRLLLNPPVDTGCVLFDLTGFSLANMDYTPVKFMIKCFEANYPESLGVVLVHKAPWVFQGIWKVVRGWLDPVVASKVHFTNNLQDLEQFIDAAKVPDDMDGKSGFTYQYVEPVPGENSKMQDTETKDKLLQEREALYEEYESKTIEWIGETDSTKRASINAERNAVAKNLKEHYWRMDPYVRSRSLYDRIGVIKADGKLDYYPSSLPTAPSNDAPTAVDTAADDVD